jgi:hypothetical protein
VLDLDQENVYLVSLNILVGKWTKEFKKFLDFRNNFLEVILKLGPLFGVVGKMSESGGS